MSKRKKFQLRFEDSLMEKVTELAKEHHISANKLIVDATVEYLDKLYTRDEKKSFMSVVLREILQDELYKIFKEENEKLK